MTSRIPDRFSALIRELNRHKIPFSPRDHPQHGWHLLIETTGQEAKLQEMLKEELKRIPTPQPPSTTPKQNSFLKWLGWPARKQTTKKEAHQPADLQIHTPELAKLAGKTVSDAVYWTAHLKDWAALASGNPDVQTFPAGKDPLKTGTVAIRLPEHRIRH